MFTFAELYETVVSRAGGEQSTADDVVRVERSIRIVLERWMTKGVNTWRVQSHVIPLTGVTATYTLPECVDDVLRVQGTRQGGATADLRRIHSSEYMQLPNKLLAGYPSQYWLERSVPPRLHVFPIGETTGNSLVYWCVERPKEYEPGVTGLDSVPGRWLEATVAAVAHDLACSRPNPDGTYNEPLIARLDASRREAEDNAMMNDRERVRYRYKTSYSRS